MHEDFIILDAPLMCIVKQCTELKLHHRAKGINTRG